MIGRFRLNISDRLLLRDREIVQLTPKVFDILLALVESSGQVISKDGLMKRVWPDSFVEEGNLTQNISLLRKALGEGHNGHQYIETVARRGYRFVAPVRESWDEGIDSVTALGRGNPEICRIRRGVRQSDPAAPTGCGVVAYVTTGARRLIEAVICFIAWAARRGGGDHLLHRQQQVCDGSSTVSNQAVLPFVMKRPTATLSTSATNHSAHKQLSQLPKLRSFPAVSCSTTRA